MVFLRSARFCTTLRSHADFYRRGIRHTCLANRFMRDRSRTHAWRPIKVCAPHKRIVRTFGFAKPGSTTVCAGNGRIQRCVAKASSERLPGDIVSSGSAACCPRLAAFQSVSETSRVINRLQMTAPATPAELANGNQLRFALLAPYTE